MVVKVAVPQGKPLGQLHQFAAASREPQKQPAVPPPPRVPPVATGFAEPEPEENKPQHAAVPVQVPAPAPAQASQAPVEKANFEEMLAKVQHDAVEKVKEAISQFMASNSQKMGALEEENRSLIAIVARQHKELTDFRNAMKAENR